MASHHDPVALEDLAEQVEEADALASQTSSMPSSNKQSNRMSRFSRFLPTLTLNTNTEAQSKSDQDPVLRKQPPPPQQQIASQAPTRGAPSIPNMSTNNPLPPLPPISTSNRLQKTNAADRPNHRHPSPAQIDDVYQPTEKIIPPRPIIDQGYTASPTGSRPNSAHSGSESDSGLASKRKRSSWMPGSRSRSRHPSQELETKKTAWIQQGSSSMDYSLTLLLNGDKVPELWTEDADTFIYLFPRSSGHGPSFRLHSHLFSSSQLLLKMMESDIYSGGHNRNRSFGGRINLAASDASRNYAVRALDTPPITPNTHPIDSQWSDERPMMSPDSTRGETHLFFPTGIMSSGPNFTPEEVQRFVDTRNLFAFLTQQPLVATRQRPHHFQILLALATQLKQLDFSNMDGSSFGEAAALSFDSYLNDLKLADVRESREKTLEAIVLAEAMRSTTLYDEAFAHAVGKYDSIKNLQLPIFGEISQTTRNRLERSFLDLKQRQAAVSVRLTTFEFPSLFAGIAASTSSDEAKYIHFKQWKVSFLAMRKFVMSYYKDAHGQWPPKASSKKNQFVEGGLNRLVLTMLYKDLCQLYSLLVDRTSMTTRSYDEADHSDGRVDPTHRALRTLLSEYDRSSPPVQPPIPFDVPLVPGVSTVNPGYSHLSVKDQVKEIGRKLKSNERILVLTKSHNLDSDVKTKFIQAYKEFEHSQAEGKNSQDLANMRYGYWIFLYAVIQALPMLVIDAPGVQYTEGVEYFLCQPSVGSPPWMEDAQVTKKAWYGVQGGHMVSLPSHIVDHGIEAVYRRSYCWVMANRWLGSDTDASLTRPPPTEPEYDALSPLEPPPGLAGGQLGVRPQSRGRTRNNGSIDWSNNFASLSLSTAGNASQEQIRDERQASRSQNRKSIALGLEKLPIPGGYDNWSPHVAPVSGGGLVSAGDGYPSSASGYPASRTGSVSSDPYSRNEISSAQANKPPSAGGNPGTTFDDILGAIENNKTGNAKGKGKKK